MASDTLAKWFPFATRTLCDTVSVKLELFMLACMATVFLTNYLLALSIPTPCQKCPPPPPPPSSSPQGLPNSERLWTLVYSCGMKFWEWTFLVSLTPHQGYSQKEIALTVPMIWHGKDWKEEANMQFTFIPYVLFCPTGTRDGNQNLKSRTVF